MPKAVLSKKSLSLCLPDDDHLGALRLIIPIIEIGQPLQRSATMQKGRMCPNLPC